jgi:phosphatidylglycerophosphate synthase
MRSKKSYVYSKSTKSVFSDEPVNTYLVRPAADILVRLLYQSSITPNQVTVASTASGIAAAILYLFNAPFLTMLAGLGIVMKDLLDSADGQLARAKQQYSRRGRFLDSLGDFVVNLAVFASITTALTFFTHNPLIPGLGLLAFLGTNLRVSYHVFYQISYLHLHNKFTQNRITEEITDQDGMGDRLTLHLQSIFVLLYGWQDRLMARLDGWSRNGLPRTENHDKQWYGDHSGLLLSGLFGLGTELFILMMCSVTNELQLYLYINLFFMNGLWLVCILYRRFSLFSRLSYSMS